MNNNTRDFKRIQTIIDCIQNQSSQDPEQDMKLFQELLTLSQRCNYLYGQALAHVNIAQTFQILQDYEQYETHISIAKSIAERKDFFDILVQYYNLEGCRLIEKCDDIGALSLYLKAIDTAQSIQDHRFCSIFYNNIGEILYDNHLYPEARDYYLLSLKKLELVEPGRAAIYQKCSLINLVNLFCLENDLKSAKDYLEQCRLVECEAGILPLAFQECEIRVLLLEGKQEQALELITALTDSIKSSGIAPVILQPIMLYLMEILMELKQKELSCWCLENLEMSYRDSNQYTALRIQNLRITYNQLFGDDSDALYEEFYDLIKQSELLSKAAAAESFRSFISLFKAEQQQQQFLKEQQDLEMIVDIDELTRLYNRRYYQKLLSKSKQDTSLSSLTYIMIDVDHFKEYNDYYGHAQGDIVLKKVADALQDNLPSHSYAARYGGDEFSCLLLNKNEEQVSKLIKAVKEQLWNENLEHVKSKVSDRITLSFGAYLCNSPTEISEQALVKRADDALYQSKRKGRNTYTILCNPQ